MKAPYTVNNTVNKTLQRSTPASLVFAVVAVALTLLALTSRPGASEGTTAGIREALDTQRRLVAEKRTADRLNDLGNLLNLAGHLEEASATYQAAIELEPENTEVLYNLALLRQTQDRPKEALRLFRQVVKLDPESAWAHFQIGSLLSASGSRQGAIEAYTEAFSLDSRLALEKVNPQASHNPEATAALLRARPRQTRAGAAPHVYSEPSRIASLLLAHPATAESGTRGTKGAETASTEPSTSVQRGATLSGDDFDGIEGQPVSETSAPRSSRPNDIQRGGTTRTTVPRGNGSESASSRRIGPEDLRESTAPAPPRLDDGRSSSGGARPAGSNRFRPGPRSSARLELNIVPLRPGIDPLGPEINGPTVGPSAR